MMRKKKRVQYNQAVLKNIAMTLQAKTSENGAFGFLSADVDFTWEELQNPG
jgi:hypothetical protein